MWWQCTNGYRCTYICIYAAVLPSRQYRERVATYRQQDASKSPKDGQGIWSVFIYKQYVGVFVVVVNVCTIYGICKQAYDKDSQLPEQLHLFLVVNMHIGQILMSLPFSLDTQSYCHSLFIVCRCCCLCPTAVHLYPDPGILRRMVAGFGNKTHTHTPKNNLQSTKVCSMHRVLLCIWTSIYYMDCYRISSWWRWSWRSYAVLSHLLCFLVMIGFCVWLGAVRKILIMFSISFFCF